MADYANEGTHSVVQCAVIQSFIGRHMGIGDTAFEQEDNGINAGIPYKNLCEKQVTCLGNDRLDCACYKLATSIHWVSNNEKPKTMC